MHNLSLVRRALAGILVEDLRPLIQITAADAVLTVTTADPEADDIRGRGRDAVAQYFRSLGGIPSFWQVRLIDRGEQVMVLGQERFTSPGGLEANSEFTLLFELAGGRIVGLRVLEGRAPAPDAFDPRLLPGAVTISLPERAIFGPRSDLLLCH